MSRSILVMFGLMLIAVLSGYLIQRDDSSCPESGCAQEQKVQVGRPSSADAVQAADPTAAPVALPVLSLSEERQLVLDGKEFLRIANHPYGQLGEDRLHELAIGGDADAQEILAFEISTRYPDQAMEWARRAADQGRPLAAILVSDILGQAKSDPVSGYVYLVQFERRHGADSLASRYRKKYPVLYATSPGQIKAQANLLLQNEVRSESGSTAP